jgi:hypothetical protein
MKTAILSISMLLAGAGCASADTVTLVASGSRVVNGVTFAASASFTLNDTANTLSILIQNTIPNTATNNAAGGTDLSAIFWTFTNAPSMDATSGNATLASTSHGTILSSEGWTVQQMWGFHDPNTAWSAPHSARQGISAAGLGIFSNSDLFASGTPLNGFDGTIVSPTGNPHSGKPHQQYRSFVQFTFNMSSSFFAGGIHNIGLSNASAQFDTVLTGANVDLSLPPPPPTPVPLPPAAMAGLSTLAGVVGLSILRRRRLAVA